MMPGMVRKVFWLEPYRTTLDTSVVHVAGSDITVAETIFFAFSGGQESDRGTIGGRAVREARTTGVQRESLGGVLDEQRESMAGGDLAGSTGDIVYTLDPDHGLAPGDPVTIAIDWTRRYQLMRLHFAAELVLELVQRRLAGIEKIGAHIAEDKARIDFRHDGNIAQVLPEIASQADAIIRADQPIISAFSDEDRGIRYWEVAGFSRVPCGGTHLASTGEVGELVLKRKNPGKAKERIEIYLQRMR